MWVGTFSVSVSTYCLSDDSSGVCINILSVRQERCLYQYTVCQTTGAVSVSTYCLSDDRSGVCINILSVRRQERCLYQHTVCQTTGEVSVSTYCLSDDRSGVCINMHGHKHAQAYTNTLTHNILPPPPSTHKHAVFSNPATADITL